MKQSATKVFQLNKFTEAIRTYSGNVWEAKHVVTYNKGEMVYVCYDFLSLLRYPASD